MRHSNVCMSWDTARFYDRFYWKCYTPKIHQIEKLKFLGTESNGRAASGRGPAARHRSRTTGPRDFSESDFPLFFPLFFVKADVSPIWNRTSINQSINIKFRIGRLFSVDVQREINLRFNDIRRDSITSDVTQWLICDVTSAWDDVCRREVGGWGRDPKICTGRDWGMGSSTI